MEPSSERNSTDSSTSSNAGNNNSGSRKLHETVSKRFDRASNGKIFTKNLNEIFSILLISLKLSPESNNSLGNGGVFKVFRNKIYPFSFSFEDAISHMDDLELKVNLPTTCTTFSYSVKTDLAISLIRKFTRAKWLHHPADRTRIDPKPGVLIQPTPKGCAILQNFCLKIGLKGNELPSILNSNFNSMNLVFFERDPNTDNVIQSQYLIHLLFVKFLGPKENIWHSTNDPDPIPSPSFKADEFDFNEAFISFDSGAQDEWNPSLPIRFPEPLKKYTPEESPFHHRFFTNPESDAHVQYYVSNKGLRLFEPREFGVPFVRIGNFFSGKSAVQWFMDCTDCLYNLEAAEIISLFIKHGLVKPITLAPSKSPEMGFKNGNDCFYTLTTKGYEISQWDKEDGIMKQLNESTILSIPEDFSLKDVLEDPGCRFLFRQHLEQEHCLENLDAYTELSEFFKSIELLKKLLQAMKSQNDRQIDLSESSSFETAQFYNKKNAINRAAVKLANVCLSKSYSIYSSFLSDGSPYEINISDDLREESQAILVHPTSPLCESFPMSSPPITSEQDEGTSSSNLHNLPMNLSSESLGIALKILERIDPLFQKTNQHIFFLLSQDSFPKFINSKVFQENTRQTKLCKF